VELLRFDPSAGQRIAAGSEFVLSPLTPPEAGEWHEAGSDEGMSAVVLEGEISPYRPQAGPV
jgi:hypothetical protein